MAKMDEYFGGIEVGHPIFLLSGTKYVFFNFQEKQYWSMELFYMIMEFKS